MFLTTMRRRAFYSFHYADDVMRAAQVRNMGVIEGNRPASDNGWEKIKMGGDASIRRWIANEMHGKSVVIVLIGEQTAQRKWVRYEIKKAWEERKGLLGIHIHGLKVPIIGTCCKGKSPFDGIVVRTGRRGFLGMPMLAPTTLGRIVPVYNPQPSVFSGSTIYNSIKFNLADWIEEAITVRGMYV